MEKEGESKNIINKGFVKKLIDLNPNAVRIIDVDYNILFTNDMFEQYYEIDSVKIEGEKCYDFICSNDCNGSSCTLKRVLNGEEVLDEKIHIPELGKHFNYSAFPIHNDRNEIIALFENLEDITEQISSQEDINAYEVIISKISEPMSYVSKDFVYKKVNDAYLKYFNHSREEIENHTVEDLFGREVFLNVIKPRFELALKGQQEEYKEWFDLPNGKRIFLGVSYIPVFRNGKVESIVVSTRDLTDMKKNQENLDLSQKIARLGSFDADLNTMQWVGSKEFCEIFGFQQGQHYKVDELLAIIHPDDVARIKKEAVDQINTEDFLSFEFRVDIPDKEEEIQVQSRTLIFKNNDSKPVRAIGVMQDITEVRDTEYALQKSESFNKKIIESNNDCIKVLDKNGKIVFINQGGIDAFEIEHVNEIIDKPWLELWSGENVDEAEQNLHAALKGNPQSFVGFCETAKGNLRWWEVFLSPLHYSAKAKERLLVVSRDITSRKKTEDALKCSLDLYTMMNAGGLDNIIKHGLKEALSITDSTIACFHFVDNRNKSIVLNSCLNTEGKNEYKVIDKEAIPLIKSAIFQKTVEVGEAVIENEMKDEHFVFPGTKRKLNRCLTIPVFENSEIIAVIGVGNKNEKYTREDVVLLKLIEETIASVYQRKSREQALVQEKQRAKESDRLKSAFLANLSHEIRTPITGIMGFTDLLLHKVKNAENQIKYAQKIKSNSNQLLGIVNDIIDISKIEAGLMPVKKSPTNLRLLISEALSFLEEEKRKRNKVGILLKTHIERGYYNLTVDVDVDKLDQIIKKLLDNALKFTNSGFIEVGIDSLAGKTITFYVKDTGVGIEKDAQKWIFERFRQEDDSLNRKFGGIGLGLAICKGLVELLNGEIWIHSEPNVGTDVYFSIEAENVTGIEKVADFRQPPNSWKNKKILIVEDEESNSIYIEELMVEFGLRVVNVSSAEDAYSVLAKEKPDLVIMDLSLPGDDGLKAMKTIKKMNPDIPVVAQTAYSYPYGKDEFLSGGGDGYLSKPFDKNQMFDMLNKLIK